MECRERYFMIAVDLSFTGKELRFEAVGKFPLKASLLHWSIFFYFIIILKFLSSDNSGHYGAA